MQINTNFDLEQVVPYNGVPHRIIRMEINGEPGNVKVNYWIMNLDTDEAYMVSEIDLMPQP